MQPSELMAANVSQAFALLTESFASYGDSKKQGENFLDHSEAAAPCGDVPKQVGVGTRQHFHHLSPQGQSSVCSAYGLRVATPGQGEQVALALPQQEAFCPEISQKRIHGKDTCFL